MSKLILLRHGESMWNHRNLQDPIQAKIEDIIHNHIPEYGYGKRRENQTPIIEASGLFQEIFQIEGQIEHQQTVSECVTAWRSHATLQRQAGESFSHVITDIEDYLTNLNTTHMMIPYTTRIWFAQLRL